MFSFAPSSTSIDTVTIGIEIPELRQNILLKPRWFVCTTIFIQWWSLIVKRQQDRIDLVRRPGFGNGRAGGCRKSCPWLQHPAVSLGPGVTAQSLMPDQSLLRASKTCAVTSWSTLWSCALKAYHGNNQKIACLIEEKKWAIKIGFNGLSSVWPKTVCVIFGIQTKWPSFWKRLKVQSQFPIPQVQKKGMASNPSPLHS